MTSTATRRPLPALIFLVALTLLTALVWWRVLNRGHGSGSAQATTTTCPTPTVSQTVLPQPAGITVQVLNSTQRAGIAGTAQTALKAAGFSTPTLAANDVGNPQITGIAEIRYSSSANLAAATLVSYYFPGSKLVAESDALGSDVVVSLGTGFQTVATAATVKAALTAHHQSLASAAAKPTPHASSTHPATGHATTSHPASTPAGSSSHPSSPTSSCA